MSNFLVFFHYTGKGRIIQSGHSVYALVSLLDQTFQIMYIIGKNFDIYKVLNIVNIYKVFLLVA